MRYEILNSTGDVVNTIEASQAFVEAIYPYWRLAVQHQQTADTRPRHITAVAFLQRIGMQNQVAIDLQSLHNPLASQTAQTDAAALRVLVEQVKAAKYIDLDNPTTISGMSLIASLTLPQPVTAVLTAPVQDSERP